MVSAYNFFIQRIETQIERGIPDVHYVTYGGHSGWIEGKYVKTPKISNKTASIFRVNCFGVFLFSKSAYWSNL